MCQNNYGTVQKNISYGTKNSCLLFVWSSGNQMFSILEKSHAWSLKKLGSESRENPCFLWLTPSIPAPLQYCLPSHVCLLGGTKSSLGMTSRHHEAVNKQEKELVHYYWELPRQKPTSFGGIKHGRGANWLFQINESFLLNIIIAIIKARN